MDTGDVAAGDELLELIEDEMAEGKAEGLAKGQELLSTLIQRLLADNRFDDAKRATADAGARAELLTEYHLHPAAKNESGTRQ